MGDNDNDNNASNDTEPHVSAFVPHAVSGERREKIDLDPAGHDPGEEDPEMSDTLDEALALALPGDDVDAPRDIPVSDMAQEVGVFPLLDADPMDAPDDEVGDVDDEERMQDEADAVVVSGRVS